MNCKKLIIILLYVSCITSITSNAFAKRHSRHHRKAALASQTPAISIDVIDAQPECTQPEQSQTLQELPEDAFPFGFLAVWKDQISLALGSNRVEARKDLLVLPPGIVGDPFVLTPISEVLALPDVPNAGEPLILGPV